MTTDSPALPLRSGLNTLQSLPEILRKQAHQMIIRSVAASMRGMDPELKPEHAVAATFAEADDTGFISFHSDIGWLPTRTESVFVQDITTAIELERQTGLYEWGAGLQRIQRHLGKNAQLIAVTAMMGLSSHQMTLDLVQGIVYVTYVGDGQIMATLLSPESEVRRALYSSVPGEYAEVVFPSGSSSDIRGDLAYLYSVLTASDEEIRLLS